MKRRYVALFFTVCMLIVPNRISAKENSFSKTITFHAGDVATYTVKIPDKFVLEKDSLKTEIAFKGNLQDKELTISFPEEITLVKDEETVVISLISSANRISQLDEEYGSDGKVKLFLLSDKELERTEIAIPIRIELKEAQ